MWQKRQRWSTFSRADERFRLIEGRPICETIADLSAHIFTGGPLIDASVQLKGESEYQGSPEPICQAGDLLAALELVKMDRPLKGGRKDCASQCAPPDALILSPVSHAELSEA